MSCYDDGTVIRDAKGRPLSKREINRMVKQGWLIPIEGESLFSRLSSAPPGDVPQRYRARTPDDGPLPRFTEPRRGAPEPVQ